MIARDGLAAEYLLNANADDSSGNGFHGKIHGATPTADRFGNANGALLFDGKDAHIVVSPPPALSDTALTVSAWARYDTDGLTGWTNCIVCQDNGDDDETSRRIFQLSTWHDRIVWHRMIQARDPASQDRVTPGMWCHAVAVFADGLHRLYVNGALHDLRRHRLAAHREEPIYIGRKGTPEKHFFFNGAIDDVGLIRLRGHNPKGGYDVHDVRHETEAKPAELYRRI